MKWFRKARVVPEAPRCASVPERVEHPVKRLERLAGATLAEMEREAALRAQVGLPPGAVDEVRDAAGYVVDLRPRRYSDLATAGLDYRAASFDDGERAGEIQRLRPLAARWALRRALSELDDLPPSENAPQGQESPRFEPADRGAPAPSADVALPVDGFEANRVALGRERARVEKERLANRIAGFTAAEQLRTRLAPEPRVDAFSWRVRLIGELVAWDERHTELAAEIARAEGR